MVPCDSTVLPTQRHVQGGAGDATLDERAEEFDWLQRDESCLTMTEQGPMYVRDGLLSFYNPTFGALYE